MTDTNADLAERFINEHAEFYGVAASSPSTKLWHVLVGLIQWCDQHMPRVDFDAELGEVREFLRDNA